MKNKNYDKVLTRLIGIIKKLNAQEKITKKALAKEHGVTQRTIQKDMNERLSNFFPIIFENGYYKYKDNFDLKKLTNAEELVVLEMLKSISKSFGTNFEMKATKMLDKLCNIDENFILSKMVMEDLDTHLEMVKSLQQAITDSKIIKFHYKKPRVVEPYKITIFEGFWYLYARDRGDRRFKTFYVKDIKNLSVSNDGFEMDKDKIEILKNAVNIWFEPDSKPFEVIFYADKSIAKYFFRKSFFNSQKILENYSDGSIKFSIQATSKKAVLYEAKKWLPDIYILSPQSLKEEFVSMLQTFCDKQITFSV